MLIGDFLEPPSFLCLRPEHLQASRQESTWGLPACCLARCHKVALKEGREALWASGKKARGSKMAVAALHGASRAPLSRDVPTCSAASVEWGHVLGTLR